MLSIGEGNDRIKLSTLHSAKGREFTLVVLFGAALAGAINPLLWHITY